MEDVGGAGIFLDGFEREDFSALVSGNVVRRNLDGIHAYLIGSGIGGELQRITRIERNFALDNRRHGIVDESFQVAIRSNRALGNGVFDCYQPFGTGGGWSDNVGLTDSPATLCRAP